MAKTVDKVTYTLNLAEKLKGIKDPSEVKKEIGNYLIEQILSDVGQAKSPVTGRDFKGLSTNYRKFKKNYSSSSIANLELHGDMLDSLKFEDVGKNKIEIGIFNKQEAQKADNHNKFSQASLKTNVPKRQFIPKKGESFRPAIRKEIEEIIDKALSEEQ